MGTPVSGSTLSSIQNQLDSQTKFVEKSEEKENFLSGRDDPKLSTSDIFDRIRPLICSINSCRGESSGFFINHVGTILTVAHNIPTENVDEKNQFTTDFVQIVYACQDRPYFPKPSEGIVQEHARALDLYSMKSEIQLSESDVISILPENIQLKEGMKVYFAGYPLGQDTVTFHTGIISSITEAQGIRRFTIDGTIVPGNSGGPVVIQHKGELYLVGVITSEVADFSPEDQKTIKIMEMLKEHHKSNPKADLPAGRFSLGMSGITTSIQIQTSQGIEMIQINDRDTIFLVLDFIQRNLSTGIGKAIDIRHYEQLFQKEPKLEEIDRYSFPVGKGKKVITGTITEKEGNRRILAKYSEVRYGAGKGNRGIRISLTPILGKGSFIYKFSPNPHTAQGDYNKNQKDLYDQAALKFVNQVIINPTPPQDFTFEACCSDYSAKRERE